MYATCLFCHVSLGKNEAIEAFPVGRRLAFDAATGRLWVVCPSCERWNLTPLEERWEAIEQCERLFRGTTLRTSTDNIGLARLREGTTLVRIGAPLLPEFAAWRYGAQFKWRRAKHIATIGVLAVGAAALYFDGPYASSTMNFGLVVEAATGLRLLNLGLNRTRTRHGISRLLGSTLATMPIEACGERYRAPVITLSSATLAQRGTFGFELTIPMRQRSWAMPGPTHRTTFHDDDALHVARQILPHLNGTGASDQSVRDAVDLIEATPNVHNLFGQVAAAGRRRGASAFKTKMFGPSTSFYRMPASERLALEIALHENDERRALHGELAVLEARWRDAEEIAAISDSMFLPAGVMERIRRLRGS